MLRSYFTPDEWKRLRAIRRKYQNAVARNLTMLELLEHKQAKGKPVDGLAEAIKLSSQFLKRLDEERNRIYNNRKFK